MSVPEISEADVERFNRAVKDVKPGELAKSPALQRLVEDVQGLSREPADPADGPVGYNRIHNRHNRGR